jgi:hypothetical protein
MLPRETKKYLVYLILFWNSMTLQIPHSNLLQTHPTIQGNTLSASSSDLLRIFCGTYTCQATSGGYHSFMILA